MDQAPPPTPYDRIGGAAGVASLVDQFYLRVFDDPDLAPFFDQVSVDRLKRMQQELFTQALGGPLEYSGRPLREVHHGRGITMAHFQKFIGHLLDTLASLGLSPAELDDVISRLNVDADKIVGQSNVDG
jgi:hemoglobin